MLGVLCTIATGNLMDQYENTCARDFTILSSHMSCADPEGWTGGPDPP